MTRNVVIRKTVCFVLAVLLLPTFSVVAEGASDAVAVELSRMAKGDLTEEEAALGPDDFAAIPETYRSLRYNTLPYLLSIAEKGIGSGDLTEEQAKLLCISIGQIQQDAKKDCLFFLDEYKGKKQSEIAISFSTRTAAYVGPPYPKHGIVIGNRDAEFRVEWDDGTGNWYEYWGSAGSGNLYASCVYESYKELPEGEESEILFRSFDSLTAGKELVRGMDPDEVHWGIEVLLWQSLLCVLMIESRLLY